MAFIDGLPEEEREALEQDFREHLAGTVPGIVAKRFDGGETWCTDPIIKNAAMTFIQENAKTIITTHQRRHLTMS